jgi:hypothetical protein
VETLEGAYQAWAVAKAEHAALLATFADERRKLDGKGSFLLGAVRAAAPSSPQDETEALVKQGELTRFLADAEEKLEAARTALEERFAVESKQREDRLSAARSAVIDRVRRYALASRVPLSLVVRPIGTSRVVLHLSKLGADDAVLLHQVLVEKAPSRYGYLADDSTDDVALAPGNLYPDEGVAASDCRPGAARLAELLRSSSDIFPSKAQIPVVVGESLFRILQRGAVLEVEVADGDAFRGVLSREEGERFTGHLLRLKLAGRVDLSIETE